MFLSMWSVWLLVFVLHCPTLHCFGAHLLSVCNNADSLLRDAPKNCTQKPLCHAHVLNDSKCIQPKPDCVYDDILIYKCKWRGCTDEESLLQEPVLRKKLLVEGRYFCIQKPICDNHTKLHNNTERCIRPKYDCTHEESKEIRCVLPPAPPSNLAFIIVGEYFLLLRHSSMGDYINIFVVICLACCTCLFLIAVLILCIWLNKKCYISSKTEQYKTVSERRAQEPPTAREHRKPPMVTFTTEQPSSSNPQTAQPQNHR